MPCAFIEFADVDAAINGSTSYADALLLSRRARQRASAMANSELHLKALRAEAECLRRVGALTRSLEVYGEAVSEANRLDSTAQGWTLWAFSNALRQGGRYQEAMDRARSARAHALEHHDYRCAVYSAASYAETLRILGRFGDALPFHFKLLSDFRKLDDLRGIVWSFEGIAQIWMHGGALTRALNLFARAQEVARLAGDERGEAYAIKGRAEVQSRLGDHNNALSGLTSALDIFERLDMCVGAAYTLKTQGDALARANRLEPALASYEEGKSIFLQQSDTRGAAYSQFGISCAMRSTGHRSSATDYFAAAYDTFRLEGIGLGIVLSRNELSNHWDIVER